VQGTPETRSGVAAVRNLLIDRPGGGHVRLREVADVRVRPTPVVIRREGVSRRIDVTAGVAGRGVDAVAGDVRARLARLSFPLEYHAQVLTPSTDDEIGTGGVVATAIAAALASLLLLQAAFASWRLAVVAFFVLPGALTGGLLVALVDGAELPLGAMVALLALFGIATRSSILLIRHLQELGRQDAFGPRLVRRGAEDRLGPVVTSAAALAVLALPFAVLGSPPGLEVLHPMALVLLGGLITVTFVTLFVLPALYLAVGAPARPTTAPVVEQQLPDVGLAQRQPELAPVPGDRPSENGRDR
jgi:Cu/Ag efflux pump CusA